MISQKILGTADKTSSETMYISIFYFVTSVLIIIIKLSFYTFVLLISVMWQAPHKLKGMFLLDTNQSFYHMLKSICL